MKKKRANYVLDSRHLKILAVKREMLKDSLVLICLDQEKYGNLDKAELKSIVTQIDKIEPEGIYLSTVRKMDIQIMDKSDFKNRDLIITIGHEDPDHVNEEEVEQDFQRALPQAKSIEFVHSCARIVRKS